MKKIFTLLILGILFVNLAVAQSVEESLRTKFSSVQYHSECGGWYLVSEEKNGQTFYGFADSKGNIVSSGASRYKKYCGFIELYLLDLQKKSLHDQWKLDMIQYNKDYANYKNIEAQYENELAAYKSKVSAAESEATRRWKIAQNQATEQAKLEAARQQQLYSNSPGWLGILGGITSGINTALAASNVKYEPFLKQVLAERNLLVEPSEPYNPIPQKPIEPSDGYYWKRFPLRQPSNYDYVDFDKIKEPGCFADVQINNKWGLVDSYMKEIIPCVNTEKVLQNRIFDNFLVKSESKYGVINKNGEFIIHPKYISIKSEGNSYMVKDKYGYGLINKDGKEIMPCIYQDMTPKFSYLLCKKDNKWGIYTSNYDELYPCQYQSIELLKFNNKLVLLHKDKGLWGALDFNSGVELLPNKYSNIKLTTLDQKDYYLATENNKLGLYDDKGTLIIPCKYSSIEGKKVGDELMLEVKDADGTLGLFQKSGIPVIKTGKYISYEWVLSKYNFASSYFIVKSKTTSSYGVCNLFGTEIIPCIYSALERNGDCFIATKYVNGEKMNGCVSYLGKEIFPFVKSSYISIYEDYFSVITYLGMGAIDYNGQIIVPFKKKNNYAKIAASVTKLKNKNPNITTCATEKRNILNSDYKESIELVSKQYSKRKRFSFYAQNYVERIINDWQKKGEFEKVAEWRNRVNENTMNQKVFVLTKEAQDMFIKESDIVKSGDNPYIVGNYDPDNETFRIKTDYSNKELLVKVSPNDAQEFKNSFQSMKKVPSFFIDNDDVSLSEYVFSMANGKKYVYSNTASLTHSVAQVNYNFDAIEINTSAISQNSPKGTQTISTGNFVFGTSDVDVNIPSLNRTSPNTFAVIIANENYSNEKNVDFAFNDGQVFRDYCIKTIGIPSENIHFRSDATLNNMKYEINWIKEVAKVNKDARFIFYYAGHGVPDEVTKEAYLLPVDGYVEDASSGYKLSELYAALGGLPANNVLVLLDACFTGVGRNDVMLADVRGVRITPKSSALNGNMVVFTATSSNQTAHPYTEQSHGLFTYYLLKGLQKATNNNIELGDLFKFIKEEVSKKALIIKSKTQTPTVIVSPSIMDNWSSMTI